MRSRRKAIFFLILLVTSSFSLFPGEFPVAEGAGANWLTGWSYRKSHVIPSATGAGTNYTVEITVVNGSGVDSGDIVYIDNLMRTDFGDIRFTDDDGSTLTSCWNETYYSGENVTYWVAIGDDISSSDATIYIYFGNAIATAYTSGQETFVFFDDFEGWDKYSGNPVLSPTGTEDWTVFGSVLKDGATYHIYYTYRDAGDVKQIGHATSPDGYVWTKDVANNPVLEHGVAGKFDQYEVLYPTVWIEGGVWNMLYTGTFTAGSPPTVHAVGYANSSDGVNWVRQNGADAVMTGTGGQWDADDVEVCGLIKVGSLYYMWYDTIHTSPRKTGLANSTDLITWVKDDDNPLFSDEITPTVFKRGIYYYLLFAIPSVPPTYGGLYRDTSPTFHAGSRELVRRFAFTKGSTGWDSSYIDTPFVLTDDIGRDTYSASSDELWVYYAGYNGTYHTGMCVESDFDRALIIDHGWTFIEVGGGSIVAEDGVVILSVTATNGDRALMEGNVTSTNYSARVRSKTDSGLLVRSYRYVPMIGNSSFAEYSMISYTSNVAFYAYSKDVGGTESTDLGAVPTINVYHTYEIMWNMTHSLFYIDEVLVDTDSTNIPDGALPVLLDNENAGGINPSATTLTVDWVFARKYVYPEPTHGAWGSQETAPPSNTAPVLGGYTISDWDGDALYTDGEFSNWWLQATDADGGSDIATFETAFLLGSEWCNFTFTSSTGLWVKDTDCPITIQNDGQSDLGTVKNAMGLLAIEDWAEPTENVVVYGSVTDASSATSGWGVLPGIGFSVREPGSSGDTGGYSDPGDDDDDDEPPDGPGDPYWWMDPDNLDELSDEELEALADSLDVPYDDDTTRDELIEDILDLGDDPDFIPFSGCGMDDEEKLAKLEYLMGLSVQELRLECQSLGISYRLWRTKEPYVILIFTAGYSCSVPDEFFVSGYWDPEDWDGDGTENWDDPDMFDETKKPFEARIEDIHLEESLPWLKGNGYILIILLLVFAFMYSQVKKKDKPGSRGESLIRPRQGGYLPGERKK